MVIKNEKEELLSTISSLEQLESEREKLANQLLEKDDRYNEVCSLMKELTVERNDLQGHIFVSDD